MNLKDLLVEQESKTDCMIIDVRSPREFSIDHIKGSINLPVLYDNEYEEIGYLYEKLSKFEANKKGSIYVMKNISYHIENELKNINPKKRIIFYCSRGGNRSQSFSIVCSKIGWRSDTIQGGYKSYRRHVVEQIDTLSKNLNFIIIAGKTGVGKTDILNSLRKNDFAILDLENLASHRGSLLGSLNFGKQPSQKMFESRLYEAIKKIGIRSTIFVESESIKIGNVQVPKKLFDSIYNSPLIKIENSINERAKYLIKNYDHLKRNDIIIKKLLNFMSLKNPTSLIKLLEKTLQEKNWLKLAELLLLHHYDMTYDFAMSKRKGKVLLDLKFNHKVEDVIEIIAIKLLSMSWRNF
jgi:tRNA 2-selenouridine synthase